MAELTFVEKIQPCLVERLTDDDPHSTEEGRASRVVSLQRYKEAVLRDLSWLLNTKKPRAEDGLEALPEVAESVLNYGITDLCGVTTSAIRVAELERALEHALKVFEPRIIRHSLKVRAVEAGDGSAPGSLSFEISGQLWAQPIPEHLFIRTRMDLETGQVEVF